MFSLASYLVLKVNKLASELRGQRQRSTLLQELILQELISRSSLVDVHRQEFGQDALEFLGQLVGVPWVAMRYSAFRGSSFKYGGSDSIISIAIISSDQMSSLEPWARTPSASPPLVPPRLQ